VLGWMLAGLHRNFGREQCRSMECIGKAGRGQRNPRLPQAFNRTLTERIQSLRSELPWSWEVAGVTDDTRSWQKQGGTRGRRVRAEGTQRPLQSVKAARLITCAMACFQKLWRASAMTRCTRLDL
jgi:hypothetical protein